MTGVWIFWCEARNLIGGVGDLKRVAAALLICIVIGTANGQTAKRAGGVARETFNDIAFVDSLNGWVVGDDGMVWRTRDGGLTWQQQKSRVSTRLSRVVFTDSLNGWIIGAEHTILTTTNGGNGWEKRSWSSFGRPTDVFFLDAFRGWLVASDSIFRTSDGGRTWLGAFNPGVWRVTFWNESIGWGYNSSGTIYRTADGGVTWEIKRTNKYAIGWYHSDVYHQAVAVSSSSATFVGEGSNHYDQWAFIAQTDDGGTTWTETQFYWLLLTDVLQLNSSVVAFGRQSGRGVIYKDRIIQEASYPTFQRVVFPDRRSGFTISEASYVEWTVGFPYIHFTPLYRTRDGGLTWERMPFNTSVTSVKENGDQQEIEDYHLFQNYPNPFNARTIIDFSLPRRAAVRLSIIDCLGRVVATIVDETKEPGRYKVHFEAHSLPSGIYFAHLSADRVTRTRKLLLLR